MNNATFLIEHASANPNENKAREHYIQEVGPISASYGAVPVTTYALTTYALSEKVDAHSQNGATPSVCAVISFPSKDAIYNVFADESYQSLVKYHDKGFSSISYFIGTEQIAYDSIGSLYAISDRQFNGLNVDAFTDAPLYKVMTKRW